MKEQEALGSRIRGKTIITREKKTGGKRPRFLALERQLTLWREETSFYFLRAPYTTRCGWRRISRNSTKKEHTSTRGTETIRDSGSAEKARKKKKKSDD